jgi:hypothetical protein
MNVMVPKLGLRCSFPKEPGARKPYIHLVEKVKLSPSQNVLKAYNKKIWVLSLEESDTIVYKNRQN